MKTSLDDLALQALNTGLILKIQIRRPLGLWALKLVVAEEIQKGKIQIWGEMKAWAYSGFKGLQLDTMRVNSLAPNGVGSLIWAATMSWALEETPCRNARLLAIRDDDKQHSSLVRYFMSKGFRSVKEIGSSPLDLPLRLVWGGSGLLMVGECEHILSINQRLWNQVHLMN